MPGGAHAPSRALAGAPAGQLGACDGWSMAHPPVRSVQGFGEGAESGTRGRVRSPEAGRSMSNRIVPA